MSGQRTVTDMSGQTWRVHEEPASGPQGIDVPGGTPVLYAEHKAELRFSSSRGEIRALRDFPRDWPTLHDEALLRLCERASRVQPGGP